MKPSDVDEILTRYKLVTEIKEMEAVKVESKERSTFSQEKEEEENEAAEKVAEEEVEKEKDEEEINSVNVQDVESILEDENIDPESEIGQNLTSLLSLLQGLHNGLDSLGGSSSRQKRDISKILHKTKVQWIQYYWISLTFCIL